MFYHIMYPTSQFVKNSLIFNPYTSHLEKIKIYPQTYPKLEICLNMFCVTEDAKLVQYV